MSAVVSPKVFVSVIERPAVKLSPKIFVAVIDTRETATADTLVTITNSNFTQEETATADTLIKFVDVASADTLRRLIKSDITAADTIIRTPLILNYFAQNNSFKDYDITNFEVTLNERTLADAFSIDTAQILDINASVKGRFLDYSFNFLVEETSQQDLIQSVKGMYDVDKLLYTNISSSGTIHYRNGDTTAITAAITTGHIIYYKDETSTVVCAMAQDMVQRLAHYLGFATNIRFANFTPYNLAVTTDITYADLISNLFSWTARLPQRQINVFIRGNTLHCIQRGWETSTFDITNLPHSRPRIDKKLLRTMYNNPFDSSKNDKDDKSKPDVNEYQEETEIANPFSGVISYSENGASTSLRYSKGLLMSERHHVSNDKQYMHSFVGYEYGEIFPEGTTELQIFLHNLVGDFYLVSKDENNSVEQYGNNPEDTKRISTNTHTEYQYADTTAENIYLVAEIETSTKQEYGYLLSGTQGNTQNFDWELLEEETTERRTVHTPIGNGWYNTSVYVDGEIQGSSISQGKPGNKVSLYTINEVQKTFTRAVTIQSDPDNDPDNDSDNPEEKYEEWRAKLAPIVDISFPVRETSLLYDLTRDLYWLNRKTQENIFVDLISPIRAGVPEIQHVVDFTERIRFNGNEYFLVSNNISFTPRKLIQKLQLVRWY